MNAPIDTLAFADRFESAGFGHDQARALANAFSQAHEAAREDLVTKIYLDAKFAEFRAEIKQALADQRTELVQALADQRAEMVQALADQRAEMVQALADQRTELVQALADQNVALTRAIAENGKDISGRLWSTITVVAGVSTAISAAIGAGITLLLKAGGL